MSKLSSIKELDIFCRMNNRNIVYNNDRMLCGFGSEEYGGLR